VPTIQAIGMSPFVIAQHVSAATSESGAHGRCHPSGTRMQSHSSRPALHFGNLNIRQRIKAAASHRASLNTRISHKPSSPHNKRMKFARTARPTRNGDAPLLAAYAQRWTNE
jgi:hypothetical protein